VKAKTLEYLSVLLCNWLLSSCDTVITKVKVQIDKPAAIKPADYATVITKRKRSQIALSPSIASSSSLSVDHSSVTPVSKAHTSFVAHSMSIFERFGLDFCGPPSLPLPTKSTKPITSVSELCYIAIGTNLGMRSRNIRTAIDEIRKIANVRHVSFLYETPAAYVTNQPSFLNCVISVDTSLQPHQLLIKLKAIESEMGRETSTIRYGPRIIDLDIIMIGQQIIDSDVLHIPHALMHERAFVLVPLLDICPQNVFHPKLQKSLANLFASLPKQDILDVRRVIPVPLSNEMETCLLVDDRAPSRIFGVLNVTPDSFSDGGQNSDASAASKTVAHWINLDPNIIIDIGGESTRPDSAPVSVQEEISRVEPVIVAVKKLFEQQQQKTAALMSIDTSKMEVAVRAFELGCHILNDVYATSRFFSDRKSHEEFSSLIAKSGKSWVMMHCRGKSSTMNQLANYDEGHVVERIAEEMIPAIKSALECGVLPWQIIIDPGIGFAKRGEQNVEILRNLPEVKGRLGHLPMLIGASRKRFLGTILGREQEHPKTRDSASLALIPNMLSDGTNFVRVHDVTSTRDVVTAWEHIWKDTNRQK
jgi:dihydropteroate synthase/2-amino-4-hydroxy-6-hydroxymethyldihydropteridine diphosphokinase